ncbi:guanylate-binding protein 1-like [Protopterus annectens]|uniref:guanylate-binding protein 1-like n=1 Tax=Protopterus annectens TaxID=7888 RepID=UPI001CF9A0B7|nr:guanylate-binding protein 1-like [Protopterus annectens]XP_043936643.1 guanylate-binding protein 1-like [Protopterus annectens]
MDKPICLIENNTSGDLQVNLEALNILSEIRQPVVVIAIVGLYRTGKSYLMNKLAGKQRGFSLGSTVESHTKGIWMWCVPHPKKQDHTLVLLDTEGLGDVQKGDVKNDCWIFALAVLLSSTFVYNSMGTIDQNALDQLYLVTELTELIKVKSCEHEIDDDSCHFARFFPAFVWSVRDFTLELKVNGSPITEDEYLEHALTLKPGCSKKIQNYNFPRECIRNYFPSRKCFAFERPVASADKLRIIETLNEDELEPPFLEKTQKFCQHIFETARTKTLQGGHIVSGTLLGNLAKTYVDTICSGAIPCMENAVTALAQIENSAAVKQGHEHYMKEIERRTKFPTATAEEFSDVHTACEKEAIQIFINRSFKDDDRKCQGELMRVIHLSYEQFHQRNEQESANLCTQVIIDVSRSLEEQITAGYYSRPGGYQCFIEDQKRVVADYKAFPGKGIKADEILNNFLNGKEAVAQAILQTDKTLLEKNKEIEAERVKKEAIERDMVVMKQKEEALQQNILAQQRSYEENIQQLKIKMEEDRIKLLEEQERVMDSKLKEQNALQEKNFLEKANRMNAEIENLRQEKAKTESQSWVSAALETVGTIATVALPGWGKLAGVAPLILSKFVRN